MASAWGLILYVLGRLCKWRTSSRVIASAVEDGSTTGTETEFTAEVVRVTQILPHPNADRLEIARFEMAKLGETTYEVVVQKGTYTTGQLAAYLSVDCVVPTAHPEFKFLTERLDGKGKTHYRLKAARLRGVFSQGLLVAAPPNYSFGTSVQEYYAIDYYRAETEEVGVPTQSSKKPAAQPCPIYGVESLKKVPRLFELGEPVQVTEKIHGTNFRFGWVARRGVLGALGRLLRVEGLGYRFIVGSHRVIKQEGDGGWYGEDLWSEAALRMDLKSKTAGYKGYVFYGELYGHTYSGKPIQDLTYGSVGPSLAVFDIRTPEGTWLPANERAHLGNDLGLPEVPYLKTAPWDPTLLEMAEGKSTLDGKTQREGIVVESLEGPRRKAKFVGNGYLLRKEA